MKRLVLKTALFSTVFIVIFAVVIVVDPFKRFDFFNFFTNKKISVSSVINTPLWKIIEFRKHPKPNLILGDSRMNGLDTKYIEKVTGKEFYNFSYGGATLEEMCSTFWIASKMCKLDSVCFGLKLNHFNLNNSRDRVPGAFKTATDPLLYLVNRDVIKATYIILASSRNKKSIKLGRPRGDRSQFWTYILDVAVPRYYQNYKYDTNKLKQLSRISEFCQKNSISIFFIIPFSHIDQLNRVDTYVNKDHKMRFRYDLSALGLVYDFDYPNNISRDSDLFSDPNHFVKQVSNQIIDEVWGQKIKYAKVIQNLTKINLNEGHIPAPASRGSTQRSFVNPLSHPYRY